MKFAKMPEEPPPPPEPAPTSKKRGLSSDDSSGEESDTEDSDAEVGSSSGDDSDSEAKRAHQLSYLQKQVREGEILDGDETTTKHDDYHCTNCCVYVCVCE